MYIHICTNPEMCIHIYTLYMHVNVNTCMYMVFTYMYTFIHPCTKAADVCVSDSSRACDGLPRVGCGGDGGRRDCQAGSIALVDQPRTASKSPLPGSGPHTAELPRWQVANNCPQQPAEGQPPDGLCATTPQPAAAGCRMADRAV